MIRDLAIDIETYSSADLTRTGVYKYAEAEDFEILLFAYSADGGPVEVVDLAQGEELPKEIREALFEPETLKHAFNAAFERVCLSRYLGLPAGRYLDPGPWRCTQLHAAYFGLPLSLAGAGAALRLQERKLESGQALIRTFSIPRKDGKRQTAESPDMAEKWAAFKEYCAQDVVTEDAIRARLARFEVPDFIWAEYAMDQRINDRGVLVDTALARSAVAMDDAERIELSEELRILTGLENPNSAAQLKRWLAENETEVDSLAAKNVRRLLDNAEGRLKRVLELRQGLAKSSTRKYLAMVNAACADGRARGMFQFYGANRTGRWSGRIIQLQNLPREQPENPEAAREMVLAGDREALRERFSSVPSALSGLIRTALIAPPGKKLIVADYSAIEARVLAWLAGEEWQNELFRSGGDLYCMTASRMFGVPVEKNGENGHLRQKGKVATLACIAEGSPVLTRRGLIPIEQVLDTDEVWDGESWVTHGGVIFKGEQEVFTYDGLTATADHYVWITGEPGAVRFGDAASRDARLIQAGDGWNALRLGNDHQSGETLERGLESLLRTDAVRELRCGSMAGSEQSDIREVKGLPELLSAPEYSSEMARKAFDIREAEMHESKRFELSPLRRPRNRISFRDAARGVSMDSGECSGCSEGLHDRQNRQQRSLRAGKHPFCADDRESTEQRSHDSAGVCSCGMAIRANGCNADAVRRDDARRDYRDCASRRSREAKELAGNRRTARVYDILNAGPNHRFTVSGRLVHNCGYGGAVGALTAMGGKDLGLSDEEMAELVRSWRAANPAITAFWWAVDQAIKTAIVRESETRLDTIPGAARTLLRFAYRAGTLMIRLPSGRSLVYPGTRLEFSPDRDQSIITYFGTDAAKRWTRIESYGPKFVENIVQAVSRDILAAAMRQVGREGYRIIAHVHDEVIIEAFPEGSADEVCELMGLGPGWASGLCLNAEGFESPFYRK